MTHRHEVLGPSVIGSNPGLCTTLTRMVKEAITKGEFVGRLGMPENDHAVVMVGHSIEPIGFATFYQTEFNMVWLDLLYVQPFARRQGIGAALFAAVEAAARSVGAKELRFGTELSNDAMRALARSMSCPELYVDCVKPLGDAR